MRRRRSIDVLPSQQPPHPALGQYKSVSCKEHYVRGNEVSTQAYKVEAGVSKRARSRLHKATSIVDSKGETHSPWPRLRQGTLALASAMLDTERLQAEHAPCRS